MEQRLLVPDAGEVVRISWMVENNTRLVMLLRATGEGSHCPVCRQESQRIYSRYRRRLNDLLWEGIPVRIELRVRRFFCDRDDCGQQIFIHGATAEDCAAICKAHLSVERVPAADHMCAGRVFAGASSGEATWHPGQQLNTPSSAAPQGNQALRAGAPGVGHRRLGVAKGTSIRHDSL